jgi:hypothetical protein
MSAELYLCTDLRFEKGSANPKWNDGPWTADVAGTKHKRAVQTIGNTAEAVLVGDVGVGGYFKFRNLSATNTILLYGTSAGTLPTVELQPGDRAVFRVYSGATLHAKDVTGAGADLEFMAVEL